MLEERNRLEAPLFKLIMADPSGYTPRVAIITGSARGLGFSIASKLADDGVDIVINDLASEIDKINGAVEEIKKKGRRAIGVPADVTNEEDVKALVEKAVEALGSVDIVSSIVLNIATNIYNLLLLDGRECWHWFLGADRLQ